MEQKKLSSHEIVPSLHAALLKKRQTRESDYYRPESLCEPFEKHHVPNCHVDDAIGACLKSSF